MNRLAVEIGAIGLSIQWVVRKCIRLSSLRLSIEAFRFDDTRRVAVGVVFISRRYQLRQDVAATRVLCVIRIGFACKPIQVVVALGDPLVQWINEKDRIVVAVIPVMPPSRRRLIRHRRRVRKRIG